MLLQKYIKGEMVFLSGIISYVFLIVIVFIIAIFLFKLRSDKSLYKKKPLSFSIIALCLIVLNWILYLSSFYASIPDKVSDIIFLPIWLLVFIIGIIATLKEYKNNLFIALLTCGVSIISLMIGGLAFLVGSM